MRYSIIILQFLFWGQSFSQNSYDEVLVVRVNQIKGVQYYDNGVVIKIDSIEYHDLSFPYWTRNDIYYQDDIVRYKYCQYAVLTDSTHGNRPDTSRTEWTLFHGPHPYLFLRDTARSEDLVKLMSDENPYVKSYAFAALSSRKHDNLFSFIVDNLGDSTLMPESSSDVEDSAYPADLMIEYEAHRLSKDEKRKLKELITANYKYLTRALRALSRK
jgi:hypothetical protein